MATSYDCLDGGSTESMSHELPRQIADERLAQEFVEQLERLYEESRKPFMTRCQILEIRPDTNFYVVRRACAIFWGNHRGCVLPVVEVTPSGVLVDFRSTLL